MGSYHKPVPQKGTGKPQSWILYLYQLRSALWNTCSDLELKEKWKEHLPLFILAGISISLYINSAQSARPSFGTIVNAWVEEEWLFSEGNWWCNELRETAPSKKMGRQARDGQGRAITQTPQASERLCESFFPIPPYFPAALSCCSLQARLPEHTCQSVWQYREMV